MYAKFLGYIRAPIIKFMAIALVMVMPFPIYAHSKTIDMGSSRWKDEPPNAYYFGLHSGFVSLRLNSSRPELSAYSKNVNPLLGCCLGLYLGYRMKYLYMETSIPEWTFSYQSYKLTTMGVSPFSFNHSSSEKSTTCYIVGFGLDLMPIVARVTYKKSNDTDMLIFPIVGGRFAKGGVALAGEKLAGGWAFVPKVGLGWSLESDPVYYTIRLMMEWASLFKHKDSKLFNSYPIGISVGAAYIFS